MHDMCLCERVCLFFAFDLSVAFDACARLKGWSGKHALHLHFMSYTYRLHAWQMHYGVRLLHLQHRHVFRRFHINCMLGIL